LKKVLTLPDARLRQKSKTVEHFDTALSSLVAELEVSMEVGPGGVGIAAPQLGYILRIVMVDCSLGLHPCKNHGRLLMVNPEIIYQSGKALGREGCLSVPEWVATVPRSKKVSVRYQDISGTYHEVSATGFEARVIQHELDHLDGVLFIDRVLSVHDLVRRMS